MSIIKVRRYLRIRKLIKDDGDQINLELMVEYPKVSLIVPAWNEKGIIKSCLDSIDNLNYDEKMMQVIVVAGGSDGTYDFCKELLDGYSKEKEYILLKQKGLGKNNALNEARPMVKGQFVILLDADSIVDENWLKGMIVPFLQLKDIKCTTGVFFSRTKPNWINSYRVFQQFQGYLWNPDFINGASSICVRRSLLDKLGWFDETVHAGVDVYFSRQIRPFKGKVFHSKNAILKTFLYQTPKRFLKDESRWFLANINLQRKDGPYFFMKVMFSYLVFSFSYFISFFLVLLFSMNDVQVFGIDLFNLFFILVTGLSILDIFNFSSVVIESRRFLRNQHNSLVYSLYSPAYMILNKLAQVIALFRFLKGDDDIHFKGFRKTSKS
ncbi:MAG: glycosyltransferase [Promethearchaeota archaeon]